jgi:tRNA 5-methylaminomethyl-2-thiouridine biosynthesis bifunctional protein
MSVTPPDDRDPALVWAEDGAPRSGRFGDVYFSVEDGLAESRAVFLGGCGLPEAWAGRRNFTVGELGFGTGLNIVALLDLWRRHRPANGHLSIFSIEGFPLKADEAERALSAWPEVADLAALLTSRWPSRTPGLHRLDWAELGATIDLWIGEAAEGLAQWSGRADAWFLDGFAPSTNPSMWSDAVLDGVRAQSAPGARIATFTVAGAVRRGLSKRGFTVEKRPGHGRKRERLEARLVGQNVERTRPTIAIIGAGIAGAAVCRALVALGVTPTLIEADRPGAGGSGFPAALVTPRLDAGDAGIAGLYARALNRAASLYRSTPDAVIAEGVLQLEQAPRDAGRFAKVAVQPLWPNGSMRPVDAASASDVMGETVDVGGLAMADAVAVAPAVVLRTWLSDARRVTGQAAGIVPDANGWTVRDANGQPLATADAVVITAGWGSQALFPALGLAPVRGQADWVTDTRPPPAVAWGGYAVPTADGLLFGATHDRGRTDTEVSPEDTGRNRATLAGRLPVLARGIADRPVQSRAAVRATTPDRLPISGAVPEHDGLWVLGGLGSRGFCAAPLLGEHLAAVILDCPSPLTRDHSARVDPGRFAPRHHQDTPAVHYQTG